MLFDNLTVVTDRWPLTLSKPYCMSRIPTKWWAEEPTCMEKSHEIHKITHRLAGVWLLKKFCRVLIQQRIGPLDYTIWLWLTVRHGKSPFFMGKLTISMGHHNQRVTWQCEWRNIWWDSWRISGQPSQPNAMTCYTGDGKHTKSVAISGCYVLFLLLSTFVP